ncbi:MAG: HD domain-containing protein [Bacteroidales bacterium]|nr:HD domain-containing protein [Bacteroidales bacterium]
MLPPQKIINDPVHGFINLPAGLPFALIEHPYVQRLRRIKQLAMSCMVYPGAMHTRFQHSMGAMYLTMQAIDTLRLKNIDISPEEEEATVIATLLHDIGHGPFSHALEHSIVADTSHEEISNCYFDYFNQEFQGKLTMAKAVFSGDYEKHFLHQLVSSQVDVDRLDYLKRDSFFTGVSEGIIGSERIIKMFHVIDQQLVVEEKGIYSLENFLVSRRLMYWQVYMHKTVVSAEMLLIKVLQRVNELIMNHITVFTTPALHFFFTHHIHIQDFHKDPQVLEQFSLLDDYDIFTCIKVWQQHPDKILSFLSRSLMNRKLYKVEMNNNVFSDEYVEQIRKKTIQKFDLQPDELDYFFINETVSNKIYDLEKDSILIVRKNGDIVDMADATDQMNLRELAEPVTKFVLAYPQ